VVLKLAPVISENYRFCVFLVLQTSRAVSKREAEIVSNSTSTDWARFCRDICEMALLQFEDDMIGGPGIVVEIDESKFSKRKYNTGRSLRERWVFGVIERESRRMFFTYVQDRREETLIPIILRRIRQGSVIHCDMFRSYINLEDHGYTVFRVNHSENFVDPLTGARTQKIESTWGKLKRFLRSIGSNLGEHVEEYILEAMYRSKHGENLFNSLLRDISLLFRPDQ